MKIILHNIFHRILPTKVVFSFCQHHQNLIMWIYQGISWSAITLRTPFPLPAYVVYNNQTLRAFSMCSCLYLCSCDLVKCHFLRLSQSTVPNPSCILPRTVKIPGSVLDTPILQRMQAFHQIGNLCYRDSAYIPAFFSAFGRRENQQRKVFTIFICCFVTKFTSEIFWVEKHAVDLEY